MKKIFYLISSLAVLCFASCRKEELNGQLPSDSNLVPVTFHAGDVDTKIGLNEDGTKYVWKVGDKVGVYDNATAKFNEFAVSEVYSDGTATLEGFLTAGYEAPFYAVYPYNASAEISTLNEKKTIKTKIARDQTAVAGSIPPESVFVAQSDDTKLTFKSVTGYVCFTVDSDNIVSATLEDKNGTTLVANTIHAYVDGSGTGSPSDGATFVSLVGPFEKGKTYYMALRGGSFNKGLTFSLKDKDGKVYYKTSDTKPGQGADANKLLNLGTISVEGLTTLNDNNDNKLRWIHGVDFVFGDKIINKYTHPYLCRDNGIKNDMVCFLNNNTNMVAVANTVIIGRYADAPVTLTKTDGPVYLTPKVESNSVYITNVKFDLTGGTGAYLFTNNQAVALNTFALDKVSISVPADKHLIQITAENRPINNVIIANSDIEVATNSGAKALFNINYALTVDDFAFVNNIVYNKDTETQSNNFNVLATNAGTTFNKVVFNNNTIVNLYQKGQFVNVQKLGEAGTGEYKNNLFYFDNTVFNKIYTGFPSIAGKPVNNTNATFANNYAIYGDNTVETIAEKPMRLANNNTNVEGGLTSVLSKDQTVWDITDPTKFDLANGILTGWNPAYGAQR